ncbi:MAG: tRNA (adenosine(37)-N6)-threonylcarbamoyltransferase complex ATPase subunit type 1 TsaE [Candidatus Avoscillospira sp.]
MRFETHSPEETEALGQRLAEQLKPGDVVAYFGDLGAGKTAFTRGLARGLGVREPVTSPTYTIVNEYLSGSMPLFHFDMYRLGSAEELFDIGWEDYLSRGGVCAVEWSENVADALEDAVRVSIRRTGDRDREIIIEGEGSHADLSL